MGVDEALLKISFRIFGETFKDLRVYLSECVIKYLFPFIYIVETLSLIYSLMTSSICVKLDPGAHM